MLYTFPDYYKEFVCTADRCEDTCCAGWEIVIDERSLRKYKAAVRTEQVPVKLQLLKSIKWHAGMFRRVEGRRCAFLDQDNLCNLYKALGPDALCRTCRLYPRHIEEFEDIREVTLSISCPEVARILMTREEPVRFLEFEKDGEETYEEYDPFLYSVLADARDAMIQIAQNRESGIPERILLIHGMVQDLQRRIYDRQLFSCEEVIAKYQTEAALSYVQDWYAKERSEEARRKKDYRGLRQTFAKLYELELLREDWNLLLYETEQILYGNGYSAYQKMREDFENWMEQEFPQWKIQCEQLLVYFISTYFCGAVYDGEAYSKIRLTLDSVRLIREFLMARWTKNEQHLTTEDVIEIVYRYSREVEHSDENLEKMEKRGRVYGRKTGK